MAPFCKETHRSGILLHSFPEALIGKIKKWKQLPLLHDGLNLLPLWKGQIEPCRVVTADMKQNDTTLSRLCLKEAHIPEKSTP